MSLDFKDKKPNFDYQLWAKAHTEPAQSKSGRFLTLSAIVHAGLILAVGMFAIPNEKIQTETISIEIEEPLRPIAQGIEAVPTQGMNIESEIETPAELSPVKEEVAALAAEDIVVEKPKPVAQTLPIQMPAKKVSTLAKADLKKATPLAKPVAVSNPVKIGPPGAAKVATIDDIEAPEVDTASEEVAHSMAPSAYAENLDQDLEDIDNKQSQVLSAEKNKIDQEADAIDAENDQALESVNDQTQKNLAAIAAANEARRTRDANAIARAQENENAAREADAEGEGAGNKGVPQQGPLAGTPDGVRSLDQLRQMPGNPIPQYANRERLENQSGQVTYHAYVKKDGTLSGFRQVSSTGHANLDSKTLNALQQWRFYPGQEGWVELPFSWDLKGGAQSVDGLLRTKRSDLSGR